MDLTGSIKPRRLLKLFMLVLGGIFAVIALVSVGLLFSDSISAWAWHVRHGGTITFSGLGFHVPLNAEAEIKNSKLEMLEFHPIRGGFLTLDASTEGPVLSEAQVFQQQQRFLNTQDQYGGKIHFTAETIHGQQITYLCLRDDMRLAEVGSIGETLSCEIPDTNIRVHTMAGSRDAMRARMILLTATRAK